MKSERHAGIIFVGEPQMTAKLKPLVVRKVSKSPYSADTRVGGYLRDARIIACHPGISRSGISGTQTYKDRKRQLGPGSAPYGLGRDDKFCGV